MWPDEHVLKDDICPYGYVPALFFTYLALRIWIGVKEKARQNLVKRSEPSHVSFRSCSQGRFRGPESEFHVHEHQILRPEPTIVDVLLSGAFAMLFTHCVPRFYPNPGPQTTSVLYRAPAVADPGCQVNFD